MLSIIHFKYQFCVFPTWFFFKFWRVAFFYSLISIFLEPCTFNVRTSLYYMQAHADAAILKLDIF